MKNQNPIYTGKYKTYWLHKETDLIFSRENNDDRPFDTDGSLPK